MDKSIFLRALRSGLCFETSAGKILSMLKITHSRSSNDFLFPQEINKPRMKSVRPLSDNALPKLIRLVDVLAINADTFLEISLRQNNNY